MHREISLVLSWHAVDFGSLTPVACA
uniref:Uncharacterized protein n=1 Tax=Arundo donax TaxID=35708 RepID=A0A0A9GHH5_ARUDO